MRASQRPPTVKTRSNLPSPLISSGLLRLCALAAEIALRQTGAREGEPGAPDSVDLDMDVAAEEQSDAA
jgi:hypothetical protein